MLICENIIANQTAPDSSETSLQINYFKVKPSSVVILGGADALGKECFIKLLCRKIKPETGVITLDGHDIAEIFESERGQIIGYYGDDIDLKNDANLLTNFYALMGGEKNYNPNRIDNLFQKFGQNYLELIHLHFSALTQTQKQITKIVACFANHANLYILQNPFENLPRDLHQPLVTLIKEKQQAQKIILLTVTNNSCPIDGLHYEINQGKLQISGTKISPPKPSAAMFDSTKTKKFFAKLLEAIKAFFAKLLSLFGRAKAEPVSVSEPEILPEIETIIDNLAEPESEIEPEIEQPLAPAPEIELPAEPEPVLETDDTPVHLLIETPYVKKPEHHEVHTPKILEFKILPDGVSEPTPMVETEIKPAPQIETAFKTAFEPMTEPTPEAIPMTEMEIETASIAEIAEAMNEMETETPAEIDTVSEVTPEPASEIIPEIEPTPVVEAEIAPAAQIETAFKTAFEPMAETEIETSAEIVIDPEPAPEPTPMAEAALETIPDTENDIHNQDTDAHFELADDDADNLADNLMVEVLDDNADPQETTEQTDAPTGNDNAENVEYNPSELTAENFEPAQKDDIQNINKFDAFLGHLPNLKQVFQNALTAKPAPEIAESDAPEMVEPQAAIAESDMPEMVEPQATIAESDAPEMVEPQATIAESDAPESDTNFEPESPESMQAIDDSMQALPETSFEAEPEIDTEISAGIDEPQIDDRQTLTQTVPSQTTPQTDPTPIAPVPAPAAQAAPKPILPESATPAPAEMSAQKMIEDSDNMPPPAPLTAPVPPPSEEQDSSQPIIMPTPAPAAIEHAPIYAPAPATAEDIAIKHEPPVPAPAPESVPTPAPESATLTASPEIIEPAHEEPVDIMESEETLRKIIPDFFQGVTSEDINKIELDNPYQKFESRLDPNSALPPIPRMKDRSEDDIPAPDSTRVRYFMQTVSSQDPKD